MFRRNTRRGWASVRWDSPSGRVSGCWMAGWRTRAQWERASESVSQRLSAHSPSRCSFLRLPLECACRVPRWRSSSVMAGPAQRPNSKERPTQAPAQWPPVGHTARWNTRQTPSDRTHGRLTRARVLARCPLFSLFRRRSPHAPQSFWPKTRLKSRSLRGRPKGGPGRRCAQ